MKMFYSMGLIYSHRMFFFFQLKRIILITDENTRKIAQTENRFHSKPTRLHTSKRSVPMLYLEYNVMFVLTTCMESESDRLRASCRWPTDTAATVS